MIISDDDTRYLLQVIKSGKAMLVLGAGASFTSKNAAGTAIKQAEGLSAVFADQAGLPYNREPLSEVLSAVQGSILGDVSIRDILKREYRGCAPSKELEQLFSVCWKRIYTWNIDDTLEKINRRSVQSRIHYHGITDKVVDFEGQNVVHIIHLHGQVTKPDQGFVLSDKEYNDTIVSDRHFWYKRLAHDYLATCPIFIGSKLVEPVLFAELERAKREGSLVSGRAYLITPDDLSPIQRASLHVKGIVHVKGTLEDFSSWLRSKLPGGWGPSHVVTHSNHYNASAVHGLSFDEVSAAHHIKPIELSLLKAKFSELGRAGQAMAARLFLQGHHPIWEIAASDIPVQLDGYADLYTAFKESVYADHKLFILSGQAGSGKTTALMASALRFSEETGYALYELSPEVKSVNRALTLLKKIRQSKVILYIGDLFLYGDSFSDYLDVFSGTEVMIISTTRTGEWNEHLSRYLSEKVRPYQFQRFVPADYDPLIERLLRYIPAPKFRAAPQELRRKRLARSQNQLMIALRETTESDTFNNTIVKEYKGLPDRDTQTLFVIAGLATLARVGISVGAAREAYQNLGASRPFGKAFDALGGIVSETVDGRLLARHDIYVRHILEHAVSFLEVKNAIKAILRTFMKYNVPVIRSVKRLDSALFKSIINHNFIYNQARRYGSPEEAVDVYADFEVDFVLDGHY